MKIAMIDNTCNTGYVLMRFLNDRGFDTDLIILGGVEDHADPVNDTFTQQYFDKIVYARWDQKGIWLSNKDIHAVLDKYDFVIGSDYAPAMCYRIRKKLDVFIPHGTDIFEYPFRRISISGFQKKDIGDWLLSRWQWRGINSYTSYFLFDMTNEENESYVLRFTRPSFKRVWHGAPHIYYPQYQANALQQIADKVPHARQLQDLQKAGYRIFFHHCQHVWKNPQHDLFNKGTDKIVEGFKQFTAKHPDEKVKLVMIQRGRDHIHTLELVKELGLEDHIVWLPSMPRKHIMACLQYADIGIGELGHSWFSYNVVTEFMAMKVPIIHQCDIAYYNTIHASVYPMYPAATADELEARLSAYIQSPEAYRETGEQAHEWWKDNVASHSLDFITGLIKKRMQELAAPANI